MRIEYLPDDIWTIRKVATWLYGEWGHLNPGSTLERAIYRVTLRARARTIPLALVAWEDGLPVGTTSLVAHDMQSRRNLTPWLTSVYVLPDYRKRGIGGALCRRTMMEARRLRLGRIYLFTLDKMAFYKALGWKEMRQVEIRAKTFTIMARS
jgi:predicted N-acetyltransferase YhbS